MECVDGEPCEVCGFVDAVGGARANPGVTMQEVARLFELAARRIWGDRTINALDVTVTDKPPAKNDVLAALMYVPQWEERGMRVKVRAIGDTLVQPAMDKKYTLLVNPRLLEQDAAFVEKIMLHEAIHIGYPGHGGDFRRLALVHGAPITENMATGGQYQVQRQEKPKGRYVDVPGEAHDSLTKARARSLHLATEEKQRTGIWFNYRVSY